MEREKFVINIGRQLGSGGKIVGEIIARRLGVKLYDKELINLAARESGLCAECFEQADERSRKGVLATLVGYLRAPFTGYEGGNSNNILANESLFRIQSDVIRNIAAGESAIFVGRCADYILREHPRCVNVFITADEKSRCARLCERLGCTEQEAHSMMERVDGQRASYYNYYSSRTWGEASTYHLCVDSSVLGDEGTADFILEFAARKLHEQF
ncbi:AAA family ATPase [uncultured Alistipes sp.]|uniref:cytidylate kinase-like family protein n=1 Tax=uncultured Alistipes sp. TaxID=538949 RepID=UPI002610F53E|nr:cytidylate kinase-like family protein [uncultured Alistipes sp.]